MLDVKGSPTTSQQQNTDDCDSPALVLHAITAVDWLEQRMQCTHKTTTDIASSYTEQLFVDVIRRQLRVVLCINNYGR